MLEDNIKERDRDKGIMKGVDRESKDKDDHKGKNNITDNDNHQDKDTRRWGEMTDMRDKDMKEENWSIKEGGPI